MTEARRSLRVVMFVYNDVTRDSRVLREAASLVAAGHRVTIMGRHGPDERAITRQAGDGFDIVLVPIPHQWRTWVYRYRRPWRMYGLVRRRFLHHLGRGPAGWVRSVAFLGVAILVAIASLDPAAVHRRLGRVQPAEARLDDRLADPLAVRRARLERRGGGGSARGRRLSRP